jgi:hypothetical protein
MNIPPMENVMRIRGLLWLSQPTHPYAKLIMFGLLRHSLVAMSPTASAQSGPRGAILPWRRLSSHVIVKARCIDSWCPKGGGEHRRVAGTPCMHDSGAPSGQQGETTLWYGGGVLPGLLLLLKTRAPLLLASHATHSRSLPSQLTAPATHAWRGTEGPLFGPAMGSGFPLRPHPHVSTRPVSIQPPPPDVLPYQEFHCFDDFGDVAGLGIEARLCSLIACKPTRCRCLRSDAAPIGHLTESLH